MSTPSQRRGHVLAVIAAVMVGGSLVVGCSIGRQLTVPKNQVETDTATILARQVHQPDPKVVCPSDLKGKVGTVMYCSLTPQGSTTAIPVKLQVTSINGRRVHWHITVSTTPGHFTAPR